MIVVLDTEGGFAPVPGLQRSITVDSTHLQPELAARLSQLVSDADFFARPAHAGTGVPGAPDARRYTLTISDGTRRHPVSFADPVTDPALAALRDFVRAQAKPR